MCFATKETLVVSCKEQVVQSVCEICGGLGTDHNLADFAKHRFVDLFLQWWSSDCTDCYGTNKKQKAHLSMSNVKNTHHGSYGQNIEYTNSSSSLMETDLLETVYHNTQRTST